MGIAGMLSELSSCNGCLSSFAVFRSTLNFCLLEKGATMGVLNLLK